MRAFLIALLLLLWLILGWLFFRDYKKCCNDKSIPTSTMSTEKTGPILFTWGNSVPILGEGWPQMRDSLAALATNQNKLEITGWYCADSAPEESDSTGLNRASETRKLFSSLSDDQVLLVTKAVPCDSAYKTQKFESVSFALRVHTEHVKEIEDKTLIYFAFNSTKKLKSAEVESYLDDVAKRITKTGETVSLTGHTDNIGSDNANNLLGQMRVDVIKDYLLSRGVPKEKINASSKGESSPIAENSSEEGRSKNRRTELQIIK
ncbi:MAG: OmpA family protein [Saprospiraceae bacterium]|nr:OmpA family protein [Saprospiraceae bacterium]